MRKVKDDPVKSLWHLSHMLLLASYLYVWQSPRLSNLCRTVRHKERRNQYSSKDMYSYAQYAYGEGTLRTMWRQPTTTAKPGRQLNTFC